MNFFLINADKKFLLHAWVAAFLAIFAALIAEYVFGLKPCAWCWYQRYPYIVLLVFLPFLWRVYPRFAVYFSLLIYAVEIALAFTHFGIEKHWWSFEEGCGVARVIADSLEAELAALLATPAVPCDKPAFVFLGLSMAAWNIIYSGFLLLYIIYSFALKKHDQ